MICQRKVEPIKVQLIPLGFVSDEGAGVTEATSIVRIKVPSRLIHMTIQVGWVFDVASPAISGTMSVYPAMIDPGNGSKWIRMQPVLTNGTLPDGYEAESGVKLWEAEIDISSDDTVSGRVFAVVTWERTPVEMSDAELAYWEGLCSAQLVGAPFSIGGSG